MGKSDAGSGLPCLRFRSFLTSFYLAFVAFSLSEAYDSMDPYGNITIKWDVLVWRNDRYTATVTIYNNQLYRHIEAPGWRYGWAWPYDEVIWDMRGSEATERGNCSKFHDNMPHSCENKPIIVDFLPGTPYNQQTNNCCRGGVLASLTQDPPNSAASFQIDVGKSRSNETFLPANHTLGLPGYTCGPAEFVTPSRYTTDGRRYTQVLMTWEVICTYSQFIASMGPKCCVSLSSFYNQTVVPCPLCSCGCQGAGPPSAKCIEGDQPLPPLIKMPHGSGEREVAPLVRCTRHMCPIRVHWHVKLSYKDYWRVKVTVNNFNYARNYSQWNLAIQHPNLQSVNQVFSFNYHALNQYGSTNDTGMFWGIDYYNDMLLQAGKDGNVQTEILLRKDPSLFTFSNGWAFPRKVSFNGDECVMPQPDDFPRLPNTSPKKLCNLSSSLVLLLLLLLMLLGH